VPKRAHRTGETLFAESLYNIWAPVATGFRAPPSC
jgi:hypothetical protein